MKNFKLVVKDTTGKILHEPEFDTRAEAEQMQTDIIAKNEWNFPEGITIEIQDNTAANEAEKSKKEQKKKDRDNRIASLKTLDIDSINNVAQLKPLLKLLVAELLKDEA